MWALGVVLFVMLSGTHAFNDDSNGGTVLDKVRAASFSFSGKIWDSISDEGKSIGKSVCVSVCVLLIEWQPKTSSPVSSSSIRKSDCRVPKPPSTSGSHPWCPLPLERGPAAKAATKTLCQDEQAQRQIAF